MTNRWKTIVKRFLVPYLVLPVLAVSLLSTSSVADNIVIGEAPPDYLGVSTDGDEIRLSADTGRLQIVSFWATWCPPCLKELPVLNAVQNQAGAARIRVIAINLEEPRSQFRRAMKAFADFEITFVHDKSGGIAKMYGVKGIPFMIILDVDGTVAFKHTGYNETALNGIVDEINGLLIKNRLLDDSGVD